MSIAGPRYKSQQPPYGGLLANEEASDGVITVKRR